MPALVSHTGITEALDNLNIKPGTQRADLVNALRVHFPSQESLDITTSVLANELVMDIWGTDDPRELKKRKKSLSSLKSSLNKSLKKLSKDGKNPEGIIVSRNNTFVVSDEQKNALLEKLDSSMSGSDINSLADMISNLKDSLPTQEKGPAFSDLKKLINSLEGASEAIQVLNLQLAAKDMQITELNHQLNQKPKQETLEKDDLANTEDEGDVQEVEDEELEVIGDRGDVQEIEDDELEVIENGGEVQEIEEDELEVIGDEGDVQEIEDDELEVIEDEGDVQEIEDEELEVIGDGGDVQEIEEDELEVIEDGGDVQEIEDDELEVIEDEGDVQEIEDEELEVIGDEGDVQEMEEDELEVIGDESGSVQDIYSPNKLGEALSKYLEPEEALSDSKEILTESEEGLVAQLLARFTPKFIKIPGGIYTFGNKKPAPDEHPFELKELEAFYLGQYPVSNDLFELFTRDTGYKTEAEITGYGVVHEGRCVSRTDPQTGRTSFSIKRIATSKQTEGANWRHPSGQDSSIAARGTHPVVQVSRHDAKAFATWAGKRLPNEEEWEAAAHGLEYLIFPWGNKWEPDFGNFSSSYLGVTTAIDAYKNSTSPLGIADLLGNIYEWTSALTQDESGNKKRYLLKGGAWTSSNVITISHRQISANTWSNIIGFRCAI